jgi:hypothetical protein
MQRRTAIAAASAISISLLSGVVAVGAHLGALGFDANRSSSVTQPVAAVTAPARVANQSAPIARHDHDGSGTTEDARGEDDHELDTSHGVAQSTRTTIGHGDD